MIFSGKESKKLWKKINKIGHKKGKKLAKSLEDILYRLGCKCQELEDEVKRLSQKLEIKKALKS